MASGILNPDPVSMPGSMPVMFSVGPKCLHCLLATQIILLSSGFLFSGWLALPK